MAHQPIKRSEYIIALSKDHHAGLLFCWKIKEGLKRNVDLVRIGKYVSFFWEHHLKEHFREEEELLFDHADGEACLQARAEHLMLAGCLNELSKTGTRDEYSEFAELLIKHIRFEERILFPYLEAELPLSILKKAADLLLKQHPVPFQDNYPDDFWDKNRS